MRISWDDIYVRYVRNLISLLYWMIWWRGHTAIHTARCSGDFEPMKAGEIQNNNNKEKTWHKFYLAPRFDFGLSIIYSGKLFKRAWIIPHAYIRFSVHVTYLHTPSVFLFSFACFIRHWVNSHLTKRIDFLCVHLATHFAVHSITITMDLGGLPLSSLVPSIFP